MTYEELMFKIMNTMTAEERKQEVKCIENVVNYPFIGLALRLQCTNGQYDIIME